MRAHLRGTVPAWGALAGGPAAGPLPRHPSLEFEVPRAQLPTYLALDNEASSRRVYRYGCILKRTRVVCTDMVAQ